MDSPAPQRRVALPRPAQEVVDARAVGREVDGRRRQDVAELVRERLQLLELRKVVDAEVGLDRRPDRDVCVKRDDGHRPLQDVGEAVAHGEQVDLRQVRHHRRALAVEVEVAEAELDAAGRRGDKRPDALEERAEVEVERRVDFGVIVVILGEAVAEDEQRQEERWAHKLAEGRLHGAPLDEHILPHDGAKLVVTLGLARAIRDGRRGSEAGHDAARRPYQVAGPLQTRRLRWASRGFGARTSW
eukprot:6824766-Prymnesium_polylepis.2